MTLQDENTALVRRMEEEIFNRRNPAAIDEFIARDYRLRTAAQGIPDDREAIRQSISMYLEAFSDLQISVDEIMAAGDKVVGVFTFTGTHNGALMGQPPTGRRMSVRQIAMYRKRDRQVVEEWEVSDQLALMQQLGMLSG